jgi:hypothetical protein
MGGGLWRELNEVWRKELGDFDAIAVYQRTQSHRSGLCLLLLRAGSPLAFVKLRGDEGARLFNERCALELVLQWGPKHFSVPDLLSTGQVGTWHYLAMAPLPSQLHRPPRNPPIAAILEEIETALLGMPRPPQTPAHWRPWHGDFTPWNLREFARGKLVLVDWEDAGWGPPHADATLYRAAASVLFGDRVMYACDEAVRFWEERLATEVSNLRDSRLKAGLRQVLQKMRRGSAA